MRISGGSLKGRVIRTADGPGYRPATSKVRQAVFSMLEARGVRWPGLRVLDLFAGSGSLGLEALSRGAAEVWFVEQARRAAGLLSANLRELGLARERWRVLERDALCVLSARPETGFGLVFIDPPYGRGLLGPALEKCLEKCWIAEGGFVLAEFEAGVDLPDQAVSAGLGLVTERSYGQTRIALWNRN
ncbi:MAG: 16S rRNA (guanine(966)-N(2))-methyltransferase RsmD [Desulfovibrionaceae bacterium]|nr:16S rRNA (guanine(966)-N(2))-methyltransferase RsmD [Desulfovibrionaceae bacterium]